jgi:hypothetical protein
LFLELLPGGLKTEECFAGRGETALWFVKAGVGGKKSVAIE